MDINAFISQIDWKSLLRSLDIQSLFNSVDINSLFGDKLKSWIENQFRSKDSNISKFFQGLTLEEVKKKIVNSEGNLIINNQEVKLLAETIYNGFKENSKPSKGEKFIYHFIIIASVFLQQPIWLTSLIPVYIKMNRFCFVDKKLQQQLTNSDSEFSYTSCYNNYMENPNVRNAYLVLLAYTIFRTISYARFVRWIVNFLELNKLPKLRQRSISRKKKKTTRKISS